MYCGCPRTDRVDIWSCLSEQARTGWPRPATPSHYLDLTGPRLAHPRTRSALMAKVDSTDDNLYDGTSRFFFSITVLTLPRPLWR